MIINAISNKIGQIQADAQLREDTINGEDSTWFHNGEVLYPDYAHGDTLVVVDAKYLNEHIILNKYKDCDGSDGDIDHHLNKACVTLHHFERYIKHLKLKCN